MMGPYKKHCLPRSSLFVMLLIKLFVLFYLGISIFIYFYVVYKFADDTYALLMFVNTF